MSNCPTSIEEFIDFDLPAFTQSASCRSLYAAIAIAEAHIITITLDPCAFDELEFMGIKCSGANKIDRITKLIKCWYELIDRKVRAQHMHKRKVTAKPCRRRYGRICPTRYSGKVL